MARLRLHLAHQLLIVTRGVLIMAVRRRRKKGEAARREREKEQSKRFATVLVIIGLVLLIGFIALQTLVV